MPAHIMNVNICDKDGLIQVARTDPFVGELSASSHGGEDREDSEAGVEQTYLQIT